MTDLEKLYNILKNGQQLGLQQVRIDVVLDAIKYILNEKKDERPNNRKSNKSN